MSLTTADKVETSRSKRTTKPDSGEEGDVLVCECGARLTKEDRQVLSRSCSNQALVSVLQTYRSFLSRLPSSLQALSNQSASTGTLFSFPSLSSSILNSR